MEGFLQSHLATEQTDNENPPWKLKESIRMVSDGLSPTISGQGRHGMIPILGPSRAEES